MLKPNNLIEAINTGDWTKACSILAEQYAQIAYDKRVSWLTKELSKLDADKQEQLLPERIIVDVIANSTEESLKSFSSAIIKLAPSHAFAISAMLGADSNITLLLAKGNIDLTYTINGCTAIALAAKNSHWEITTVIANNYCVSEGDPEQFGQALLLAAAAKQFDLCKILLNKENIFKNWEAEDKEYTGYTALHFFVLYNRQDLVEKYLAINSDYINYQLDQTTPTALTLAAKSKAITDNFFEFLLQQSKLDLEKTEAGKTALTLTIEFEQVKKAALLIKNGAQLTVINRETLLLIAAQNSEWDICEDLLKRGAKANAKFNNGENIGCSALYFFLKNDRHQLVTKQMQNTGGQALLFASQSKLDINLYRGLVRAGDENKFLAITTKDDKTLLQLTIESNQPEKVIELLKYSGQKELETVINFARDLNRWKIMTAIAYQSIHPIKEIKHLVDDLLLYAAHTKQWGLCEKLLDSGVTRLPYFEETKLNAFHMFIKNNQDILIKKCLNSSPKIINWRNIRIQPLALTIATEPEVTLATFSLLLEQENINLEKTDNEETPLIRAILSSQIEKAKALLAKGAKIDTKFHDDTAIIFAANNQQWEIVLEIAQIIRTNDSLAKKQLSTSSSWAKIQEIAAKQQHVGNEYLRAVILAAEFHSWQTYRALTTNTFAQLELQLPEKIFAQAAEDKQWDIVSGLIDQGNIDTSVLSAVLHSNDTDLVEKLYSKIQPIKPDANIIKSAAMDAEINAAMLSWLLKNAEDETRKTNINEIALILAAQSGQTEKIEVLIQAGTNPACKNASGDTAIKLAAKYGRWDIYTTLRKQGAVATPGENEVILLWATKDKQTTIIDSLLNEGAFTTNLLYYDKGEYKDCSTTHLICLLNNKELLIKFLTVTEADINDQYNPSAHTPLTFAATCNEVSVDILTWLAGVEGINFEKTKDGKTAMQLADACGQQEKSLALAQVWVKSNYTDKPETVLEYLTEQSCWKTVDYLLSQDNSKSVCLRAFGKIDDTVKQQLAKHIIDIRHWDICEYLLDQNAITDKNQKELMLLLAAHEKKWDICKKLLNRGATAQAKFNNGDHVGQSALYFFLKENQREAIAIQLTNTDAQALLATSSTELDINLYSILTEVAAKYSLLEVTDKYGNTPLKLAIQAGQTDKSLKLIAHLIPILTEESLINIDLKNIDFSTFDFSNIDDGKAKLLLAHGVLMAAKKRNLPLIAADITNVIIKTPEELYYIEQQKISLSTPNLTFSPNLDCTNLDLSDTLISKLTLKQYWQAFFSGIKKENQVTLTTLRVFGIDINKRIGEYSCSELETFTICLIEFKNHLYRNGIIPNPIINKHANDLYSVLVNTLLPTEALNTLLNHAKVSRFFNKGGVIKSEHQKYIQPIKQQIGSKINISELAKVVQMLKEDAFKLPPTSPIFQIYFILACMLIRLNYPRKSFFSNKQLFEVGVYKQPIETFDFNNLIIIGKNIFESKILVADEVISNLKTHEDFQDPETCCTANPKPSTILSEHEIARCLLHPKIRETVIELHKQKLNEPRDKQFIELMDYIQPLKTWGERLKKHSSHGSGNSFNEKEAMKIVTEMLNYLNDMDIGIYNELKDIKFTLQAWGGINTPFSRLFEVHKLPYKGCTGSYSSALQQWVEAFEKSREDFILKKSGNSRFSKYIAMIEILGKPVSTPQLANSNCLKAI